jgi:hypothetical protein
MKLKVHGTLLRTGLLAASGGFAGVEEHAPESSVIRDEAEGPWYPPANRATCCKRWFCWCGGTCTRQLVAGNRDQLAARNWGKSGGHRTLSGVIICCKRWSRSCWGKCSIARCWKLRESWRASYSLGCHHLLQTLVSLVQRKVPDSSLLVGNWGKAGGHRTLSGVIICCKRWSRLCWGKCSIARCW